jgi:SAM-dependent methyltransferase
MRICPACSAAVAGLDWACPACGHRPATAAGLPLLAPELARSDLAFPSSDFDRLAQLEDGNYWFRSRNKLIVWALRKLFPGFGSFLEVGCGTGCVLAAVEAAFPGVACSGSELHVAGLAHAAKRLRRSRLLQMDARRIPFRAEFDVIGSFDVLEHIEGDREVLAQCFLALRSGGGLVLTVPQHRFLWSARDEYARHVRRYARSEIIEKLRSAGFRPVLLTSFVSLLFPLLVLARASRFDPQAELNVGRLPNMLLEAVLSFERWLIASGVRFPFGGSLLVVAEKP